MTNEKSLDIKDVIISGNPINLYSVNYVNIEDDNFNKEIDFYLFGLYKEF